MMNHVHLPLHDHEERYGMFRASGRSVGLRLVFGAIWTLLPFILLFEILRLEWYGVVLLVIIGLSGLRYLLAVRASWYGSVLVVTNERVIDVTKIGFSKPVVTSVWWNEVKEVRRVGKSIMIETSTKVPMILVLANVKKPTLVMNLISEVQSKHSNR
ncbi:TPA: hypothetical protein DEP96_00510 [Candidatus Uhrbacteria bacterium]|nr:hypothetical protein [Candidatus Uhrbacteria bacterium]